MRTGRRGLTLAATATTIALAGCGGSSSGPSSVTARTPDPAQAADQALSAVAPLLRRAGVSSSVARRAVRGEAGCPSADRGAGVGTATFTFNGVDRIALTQDACPVVEAISGHPELSYSGPGGCRGQFFAGESTTSDPAGRLIDWFRYGARDAYLIRFGNQVFHFAAAPRVEHGLLVFDHDFGSEQIRVTVSCPPPRRSGWLLPPGA